MKIRLFPLLLCVLPLAAQPSNISVAVSNTQAVLTYTAPDTLPCVIEVSVSATFLPLVPDVDPGVFTGSNSDARPGNITAGQARQFVVGKRDIELANVGLNTGRYFSRALEANTTHNYRLTCTGGNVTGTFNTITVPFGNTFGEPFQGDLANPGAAPYPYLDPTTRNSWYIDPQTGLRHVAVTFGSDYYELYGGAPAINQAYTDAADMNGATWSNPANVYGANTPATATNGSGNLWVGVRNTQASGTYDFAGRGPSYDELIGPATNGSINYYQISVDAQVSSGMDTLSACLTVDRQTCATSPVTLNLTSALQTFTIGAFSGKPDGSAGGSGADPVLFNANPPINRWQAYTHTGTVVADGAGHVAWATGNYFNTAWGAASFLRFSPISTADACANGTPHTISAVSSGMTLTTTDMPAAATYFYCANNFGVLIKRAAPDARTVSVENAKFNISFSPGPSWTSTAVIPIVSQVRLNNGFYMVLSSGTQLLYFLNTITGASTLIGPIKPNSNSSGADQWFYFQIPGTEVAPFDNTASASTGHLVYYNSGPDVNGKQVIIRTELSGTPAYQGNNINALMDETGATITFPDAFSVQVVNHGMTAKFTNITPASQGKDLATQMRSIPGFNSAYMTVSYLGVANGKLYLQGRGNQNTISVFARLDPATGLIDNYTDSWSRPNCRWCQNHSGVELQGDVNYIQFGTSAVNTTGLTADGSGPWIVTTSNPVSATSSVQCPANTVGAPTSGAACDVFTLNSHGGSNPYEPYDPDPGTHETDFLQAANPGDTFCISATTSCIYTNEIVVLVSKSGNQWTMWRPGTLTSAGKVAITGFAAKNLFAWCTGLGNGLDSNGTFSGTNQGQPTWDTTTSGPSAVWYRDLYYIGGHADGKYNTTVNGTSIPGQFVEQCEEGIFCGIPGTDVPANGYRVRQGNLPALLSTLPSYVIATPVFAGATGNTGSGSHLSVGGLATSFTDDRPFLGDGLNINWGDGTTVGNPIAGTTHLYKAMTAIVLNRKQLLTAAVAGPHVLRDISSSATGNVISDTTDFSYCVALTANECRTGSLIGDVFVSASARTHFTCYSGSSIIDVFAPGGNVAEDICVFPGGVNINSVQEFSLAPDPVGWNYGRALTYLTGKNKMDDAFANVRVMPDSTWAIGNERWGTPFRNEVVAVKMPPAGVIDSINRGSFIPVQIQVPALSGADGVVADFGYAEFGSDGSSQFYCTSRQENCVANQAAVGTPAFYWNSESFTPLTCSSGCTLTIPGLPGRVLYYRLRRTLSGATVGTETTQTRVMP